MNLRKILGIHLHNEKNVLKVLEKVDELIKISNEIWISSSNKSIFNNSYLKKALSGKKIIFFHVENKWNDWSGYLAFLTKIKKNDLIILCNDSIIGRRLISKSDVNEFISALNIEGPALIGEVDSSKYSVDLNGWTSLSWVSSYLFAIQGCEFEFLDIEMEVIKSLKRIQNSVNHPFSDYLKKRRAELFIDENRRNAKQGGMFFERWLTRICIENGFNIVNCFAGNKRRKFEKFLENYFP